MTGSGDRGSGRTTQQLLDAPNDHFFVIDTVAMKRHVEELARKHVPEKRVRIVEASDVYQKARGTNVPIVVDHAARDAMSEADWRFATAHNERHWPR